MTAPTPAGWDAIDAVAAAWHAAEAADRAAQPDPVAADIAAQVAKIQNAQAARVAAEAETGTEFTGGIAL